MVGIIALTAMKLVVGFLSGSVGVISEAIHSLLDLVSAAVTFFTVREAGKPADWEHPYGHGKLETLSSLFESLLLVAAAIWIVYEGVESFQNPTPIQHGGLAIATIVISLVVSYWIYKHNLNAAREVDSSALHVNALHFLSDVMASFGVLVGLIVIQFTGWLIVDSIMAFAIATYILAISAKQVKRALLELSDVQLPLQEVKAIQQIMDRKIGRVIGAHDLRTRRGGATRHVDFHLEVCGEMSVNESHAVCDEMETEIMRVFPQSSVNIHVEPCEMLKTGCYKTCPVYKKQRAGA